MSAATSLAYSYRYAFASDVVPEGAGLGLRLATSGGGEPNPYFFRGRLLYPREVAEQLLTLAQVVSSRFYLPGAWRLRDPVVTSNDRVLRFEGFSSCCGVYARADFDAAAFDAEFTGRGTTNVDFNTAMRTALARIRNQDRVALSVGTDQVALSSNQGETVEKKVDLPIRWLKGFTEVQAYQPGLKLKFEIPAAEARQFVRSIPRGGSAKTPSWVTPIGRGLRLSQRESKDGVRVMGTDRLRLLEGLVSGAAKLRVWGDDINGTSAWEATFNSGRFLLMISPDVWRGFSGEGQMLRKLASRDWEAALPRVRAELAWQARVDVDAIAQRSGLARSQLEAALAVLGARGLVGYDISEGAYFHRELPFDLQAVESLHLRLAEARRLVAEKKVRITQRAGDADTLTATLMVQGTDVEHVVRLAPTGDKCTCPWFSKNQGQRGNCKHILAARIMIEGDDDDDSTLTPSDQSGERTAVTSEELTQLVHDGNWKQLIEVMAPLTEPERKKLATTAARLSRQCKKLETEAWNEARASRRSASSDDPPIRKAKNICATANLAALGLCAWTNARRAAADAWRLGDLKTAGVVGQVLLARRPEWLDQFVEQELKSRWCHWAMIRRFVREGACQRPTSDAYIVWMIRDRVAAHGKWETPLVDLLRADRALLDYEIWRIFDADFGRISVLGDDAGGSSGNWSWQVAITTLAASGELDRQRLLTESLRALNRPIQGINAKWFSNLHEALEPTLDERTARQSLYVDLLASSLPTLVGFGIAALKLILPTGSLDGVGFASALGAVFDQRQKRHAIAAIGLLRLLLKRSPVTANELAAEAARGLSHSAPEVQKACLDLIEPIAEAPDATLAVAIADRIESVAASQRARAQAILAKVSPHAPDALEPVVATNSESDELPTADKLSAIPSRWRDLAGIDACIEVLERSRSLPRLVFDPMNVPRLDPAAALKPIADLDQLIERASAAVEELEDSDELELILDAMSRFANQRPADFAVRTAPLLKRIGDLFEKDRWAARWMEVKARFRLLAKGWIKREAMGTASGKSDWLSPIEFLSTRMQKLSLRIVSAKAGPMLACPTHRGGWIDPRTLVQRLRIWQQQTPPNQTVGLISEHTTPDVFDLIQALLRLAPDHRAAALCHTADLQGQAGAALRFALGSDEPIGRSAGLWIAAARARDPRGTFLSLKDSFGDLGPDADQPACRTWQAIAAESMMSFGELEIDVAPPLKRDHCLLDRPLAMLNRCVRPDYVMTTVIDIRCRLSMWPANPDAALADGAMQIVGRLHAAPTSRSPTAQHLEPLFDPDTPLSEMAQLALSVGLAAMDPATRGLAVDAMATLIADGRCTGVELGPVLAKLTAAKGMIPLNRLAESLTDVARISSLHRHVAAQVAQKMLAALKPPAPADLHYLLTPLREWLTLSSEGLDIESRPILASIAGSGKTASLAAALLKLNGDMSAIHRREIFIEAVRGRIDRAQRWAAR